MRTCYAHAYAQLCADFFILKGLQVGSK